MGRKGGDLSEPLFGMLISLTAVAFNLATPGLSMGRRWVPDSITLFSGTVRSARI